MNTTAVQIRKAEAAYQAALARSGVKRTVRDALIHKAIAEGWTHAAIAAASGLTRGRVNQIARGRR